jgi:hypothetical protein
VAVTARIVDKATKIETYDSLDDALAEQIRIGWEDEAEMLMSNPMLFTDSAGAIVAVITYTPDLENGQHPLLIVHNTRTNQLSAYRYHAFRVSYEARLAATTYLSELADIDS